MPLSGYTGGRRDWKAFDNTPLGEPDADFYDTHCGGCDGELVDGFCPACEEPCQGMAEARAACEIDRANKRASWAQRVAADTTIKIAAREVGR